MKMNDRYVFLIKHQCGGCKWEEAKSPTELQRKYPKSDVSLYNIWHTISSGPKVTTQRYIDENLEQTA